MSSHLHDKKNLREELKAIIRTSREKVDYLSSGAQPLTTIATSTSVLTIVSLQLLLNGSEWFIKIFGGILIFLLLSLTLMSLLIRLMISRARLRFSRVQFDLQETGLLECEEFSGEQKNHLIRLSHLARKGGKTIDRIQWLYIHGLWNLIYMMLIVIFILMILTIGLELNLRL